jgi:small conductance mechanosensitive channel
LRTLSNIVLGLILTGLLASPVLAQSALEEDARSIEALLDTLDKDITALRRLMAEIDTSDSSDREVLVYRQDERVFSLLADYDALASKVVSLPDESAERLATTAQLTGFGIDLGPAIFDRVSQIKQSVNQQKVQFSELSGATRVAAQAYVVSLESIRILYYEGLANHILSREALGLPPENVREQLGLKLYMYAEILAGRIEFTAAAQKNVEIRQSLDTNNADIGAALKELDVSHEANLLRMQAIIQVLDRLGLDSAEYQAVLLTHSSNLSISFLSSSALMVVLEDSWAALKTAINENAPDLLFRLLIFFAVLFVFRFLSRVTKRVVRVATRKSSLGMSELLINILVSTSGGAVMALGVLMALSQVGISLAPMLAGLGVAGFIIGFALQDSLGNFAAGAMILIYRPFDVDDFVEVTGASGLVKKMNLVSTTIVTFDNQTLVVPNSKIWGDVIKNVTAQTERRVDLVFGIGYGDDIELAERVLAEIVESHEKVLADPEPNIRLHTLADSSVNFIVRPWTKTDDYWEVYWDLTREVKMRFDREGISIPFPQTDVHVHTQTDTQTDT